MGQVVTDDARSVLQTLLAPCLAHWVVVRNDHLDAVGFAAEVRTKHYNVRSAASEVFCRGNLTVAQQLYVGTTALQTSLETHFVLYDQILFGHIDRFIKKCCNSVMRGRILSNQRLITIKSRGDKTVTPNPGLR